jgi:hypothetical protein
MRKAQAPAWCRSISVAERDAVVAVASIYLTYRILFVERDRIVSVTESIRIVAPNIR